MLTELFVLRLLWAVGWFGETRSLVDSLVGVTITAALPASFIVTGMITLCRGPAAYAKRVWLGVSTFFFLVAACTFRHDPSIVIIPLAFAIGMAVWFFAYGGFGRGLLLRRGENLSHQGKRLSTRKIMGLTLSVSIMAAIIRWLSQFASDQADMGMVVFLALACGLLGGGTVLPLALAVMKPSGWYWLIALVAWGIISASVLVLAVALLDRLQVGDAAATASAWIFTLGHFVVFCSVLRASGYRIRTV